LVPGYLVIDSFSSAEEVREMRDRMAELVAGFDGASSAVFSTKDHVRHRLRLGQSRFLPLLRSFPSPCAHPDAGAPTSLSFENSIAGFESHICLVYIALFFVVSIGYVCSLLPFINSILCILRFSIIGMLSVAAAVEG
jgi:hypothetical protein